MEVIEYQDKYLDMVKDLLVELEEHILSIDKDKLDQLHPLYRDKMAILDLEEVNKNSGKCYLAVEDNIVIGVIMGIIIPYEEYDYLDYKCPKSGEVTELVVAKTARGKGIGNKLMNKMEEYFKSANCKYVFIDVFAYNDSAINFYNNLGYHPRMYRDVKKLK